MKPKNGNSKTGTHCDHRSKKRRALTPKAKAGLRFIRAGLSVLPLSPGNKRPETNLLPDGWSQYQEHRPTKPTIRRWFTNGANIGVITGKVSGNLVTMDFDEGRLYKKWRAKVGNLADPLVIQQTGGDGHHHVMFRCPNPGRSEKLAWVADSHESSGRRVAIETKAEGGYVVVAPSVHAKSGRPYRVVHGDLEHIPMIPQAHTDALLNAARKLNECPAPEKSHVTPKASPGDSVIELYNENHTIEDTLEKYGYKRRGRRYVRPGGENPSVSIKAGRSFHFNTNEPLSDGYGHSAFDLFRQHEHGGDVKAAVKAAAREMGMSKPRARRNGSPASGSTQYAPVQRIMAAFERGETGDAEVLELLHAEHIAFDHAERTWYVFDGNHWQRDRVGQVMSLVANDVAAQYLYAAAETKRAVSAELKQDLVKELYARVNALRFKKRIQNVLGLAACLPRLRLTGDEWDRQPMLLGVQNGVVDLRTGELRPSSPGDYIRTIAPTNWKGLDTPAPRWERFSKEIFGGDRELIEFVQRLFGYALTGQCSEHVLPVLWGEGRNGKDTLLEAIKNAVGEFATPVLADVLVDTRHDSKAASPHLYDLRGRRLVWVNETNEGARLNAGQVKMLTGGGTITARPLYGSPVTFAPTHTLVLVTNHKPHANADDYALWKRLLLIPFTKSFVDEPKADNEHKRDARLAEKLHKEAPGILAWLVRGCIAWQRARLQPPEAVKAATREYQSDEDTVADFITERCYLSQRVMIGAGEVFKAYSDWAKDNGLPPMSSNAFGRRMGKRFRRIDSGGKKYVGIGLKSV